MDFRLFVFLLMVSSALAFYDKSSDVEILTDKNFYEKVLNSDDVWLVEFYAPWCGHCKQLKPTYERVAKHMKGFVRVGAIDCDTEKKLPGEYGIQGFPTLKLFPSAHKTNPYKEGLQMKTPVDYSGSRDFKSLVSFADSYVPDWVVVHESEKEFDAWSHSYPSLPKGVLFSKKPTATTLYRSIAHSLKDRVLFSIVPDNPKASNLIKRFKVDLLPALFLVQNADDTVKHTEYDGALKRDEIIPYFEKVAPTKPVSGSSDASKGGKPLPKSEVKAPPKLLQLNPEKMEDTVLETEGVWLVAVLDKSKTSRLLSTTLKEVLSSSNTMIDVAYLNARDEKVLSKSIADSVKMDVKDAPFIVRYDFDEKSKSQPVLYKGKFEKKALLEFGYKGIPDHVRELSSSNADYILGSGAANKHKVVLISKNLGKPLLRLIAAKYQSSFEFFEASATDQALVSRFKVQKIPSLFMMVFAPMSEEELENSIEKGAQRQMQMIPFQGTLKRPQIMNWLSEIQKMMGGKEDPQSKSSGAAKDVKEMRSQADFDSVCVDQGGMCVVLLVDTMDEDYEKSIKAVRKSSKKFSDAPLHFGWMDAPKHEKFLMKMDSGMGFPSLMVLNAKRKLKSNFIGRFEDDAIIEWLNLILRGKAHTSRIVGEIPELSTL